MQDTSDESLIAGLKKRDNATLTFVYKTYWPMILKFVRMNSGASKDAQELYQDCMIALYEKVTTSDFALTSSLRTYIYSIARNKWLHTLRNRKPIQDIENYTEMLTDDTEVAETSRPEDEEIMKAIENMGEPCYSLLIGFYYHKISMDELAVKLEYANSNVARQLKFRCINRLKKLFLSKTHNF